MSLHVTDATIADQPVVSIEGVVDLSSLGPQTRLDRAVDLRERLVP